MFTGLIEAVATVAAITPVESGVRVRLHTPLAEALGTGDSVAVSGVCLTVVQTMADAFEAEIGPETLRVTTLGRLQRGALVNLERPLRADSRLGGHFVQGHVDATGRVVSIRPDADFRWVTVEHPEHLRLYVIPKGSIAIDGISLTVARVVDDRVDIQVIPYTWTHTNLHARAIGEAVNIECDLLGKYVVRSVEAMGTVGVRARGADV